MEEVDKIYVILIALMVLGQILWGIFYVFKGKQIVKKSQKTRAIILEQKTVGQKPMLKVQFKDLSDNKVIATVEKPIYAKYKFNESVEILYLESSPETVYIERWDSLYLMSSFMFFSGAVLTVMSVAFLYLKQNGII